MKVKVIDVFRDKFTSQLYSPGEILYIEDETRVVDLVNRKLVEVSEGKKPPEDKKGIILFEKEFEKKTLVEALKSVGTKAIGTMGEVTLLGLVSELDEESTAKLKLSLGIEA